MLWWLMLAQSPLSILSEEQYGFSHSLYVFCLRLLGFRTLQKWVKNKQDGVHFKKKKNIYIYYHRLCSSKTKSQILRITNLGAVLLHGEMLTLGLTREVSVKEAFSPVESKQRAGSSLESEGPLCKDTAEWEKITEAAWAWAEINDFPGAADLMTFTSRDKVIVAFGLQGLEWY